VLKAVDLATVRLPSLAESVYPVPAAL
jgi:hypothetical protein